MKKIILVALMAVLGVAANAKYYAGGSLGFWHEGEKGDATTTVAILPEVGMQFTEKIDLGAIVGYQYNHGNSDMGKYDGNVFQIFPYARYNFFTTGIVTVFCDGKAGFGIGATKYKTIADYDPAGAPLYRDRTKTACLWEVGLNPGIAVKLNDHFSVVAHVGFVGYKGANHGARDAGYKEKWGLSLSGNDLTFGLYYNF